MTNKTQDNNSIPPLEHTYNTVTEEDKRHALIQFAQQIGTHFPEILDNDRDKSAAKIHIENIEEQSKLSKPDSHVLLNALQSLLSLGDKHQDDMMACALLDYIDEIIELTSSKT